MTDEWLAGFFDGEGCISGQCQFVAGKYIKEPRVNIQISITQKDRKILETIQEVYGGTVYDKKKGCSAIRWTGKSDMTRILRILAPHSICKREQILLALRFCETLRDKCIGSVPLDNTVHSERKEIFEGLKLLKDGHNL
jgi:hypothetical protein